MIIKNNTLLTATIAYYEAQRAEAIASIEVFLLNPVGVADHSNFLGEIKKWTDVLASSEENIKVLKEHFIKKK
jgi:hypothetical protein